MIHWWVPGLQWARDLYADEKWRLEPDAAAARACLQARLGRIFKVLIGLAPCLSLSPRALLGTIDSFYPIVCEQWLILSQCRLTVGKTADSWKDS